MSPSCRLISPARIWEIIWFTYAGGMHPVLHDGVQGSKFSILIIIRFNTVLVIFKIIKLSCAVLFMLPLCLSAVLSPDRIAHRLWPLKIGLTSSQYREISSAASMLLLLLWSITFDGRPFMFWSSGFSDFSFGHKHELRESLLCKY